MHSGGEHASVGVLSWDVPRQREPVDVRRMPSRLLAAPTGQDLSERTPTPGRSRNAARFAETTSRFVALAVAKMMRSWAPRGLPCRRVTTSS